MKEDINSFYSNTNLDQIEIWKEDLGFDQIPLILTKNWSSKQSINVGKIEDVSPRHIAIELILVQSNKSYYYTRESFNYLNFDSFYSFYIYLFEGLDVLEITQYYLAMVSSWLDFNKVLSDGKS